MRARLVVVVLIGLAVVRGALAGDFRAPFQSVTPTNFDAGGEVSRQFHLNAESYFNSAIIHRHTPARELTEAPSGELADTRVKSRLGGLSFANYVAGDELIDGVVVLHNGKIVFEAYPKMRPWQRHFAWSVTKVVTGTALAVLAEQGKVELDTPVERYVPALAGSAWEGIALGDVAHNASGIDCLDSDGYQTPTTCIYTMEEALGITAPTGRNPDLIGHLQSMRRAGPANTKYEYVSANTIVLGLAIENVMSMPYAAAIEELVWSRIGAEADGLVSVNEKGYAYSSGGLSARLRDIARFGQIYTAPKLSGVLSTKQVLDMRGEGIALSPADADQGSDRTDVAQSAAWQWDAIWSDGGMYKGGYLGQGLYVDPGRRLVVAWFGTGLDFSEQMNELLPVTRQLVRAGLFDLPEQGQN